MTEEVRPTIRRVVATTFCVLSVGGAWMESPCQPPRAIVLESGSTQGASDQARTFDFRGTMPTLMANPQIRTAALRLERQLTDFLGPGHGIHFVFEELLNPDDPDQCPLLFAVALLPDEGADALLDAFILEQWSNQPTEIRRSVRIGREFV